MLFDDELRKYLFVAVDVHVSNQSLRKMKGVEHEMQSINILIVESDLMVLFSIGQVIRYFDNYQVIDQVKNVEESIEIMKSRQVDLVVVGGQENADGWKYFTRIQNKVRVIILAHDPSSEFIQDAFAEGAWDVILRPATPERLRFSLEMFRYRFMAAAALDSPIRQDRLDAIFFPRERYQSFLNGTAKSNEMLDKVMRLIEDGKSPQSAGEIAEVLNVSRITVRKYCEALVSTGRLRVRNKYQTKGRPIKQYFTG